MDSVVSSWSLCTIPDVTACLKEIRRVLKPGGQFRFVEHGLAPETRVSRWQHRLSPVWRRFAGGCHLNLPVSTLIENAGFEISRLDTGYMSGPKPTDVHVRRRCSSEARLGSSSQRANSVPFALARQDPIFSCSGHRTYKGRRPHTRKRGHGRDEQTFVNVSVLCPGTN